MGIELHVRFVATDSCPRYWTQGMRSMSYKAISADEKYLRWWALSAMALMGALVIIPVESMLELIPDRWDLPPTRFVFGAVAATAIFLVVGGFCLRMSFECGRNTHHRGLWFALLFLLPVL